MHHPREGGLNIELKVERVGGSGLVREYVSGAPAVEEFFGGSYRDGRAYERRAKELDERFGDREEVATLLRSSGMGEEALERFVEGRGYVVSAGQQPGLFGGPLYSIYKGISAVTAARSLEKRLGRPVLPLFWIASEDHDWEEARTVHVLDPGNELHSVSLPVGEPERNRPLFRVPLDERIVETLDRFLALHPETDFSREFRETLEEGFSPGRTLVEGFRHFLESLLGPLGLHFVEAHLPELKERSLPLLLRELEEAEEHEARLRRTAERISGAGDSVQVPILEGGVNLFVEGPAGRERLYRDGPGSYHLRHSRHRLSAAEVRELATRDPSVLSPNVLLRPVVENSLFPVLAHVVGPGEIGYYAQLRPLFEAHGQTMPVVLPRHSVTVLERKILKVLEKFDLEAGQLQRPHHELAGTIVREEIPEGARRALGALRGGVARGTADLTREVEEIDPTLRGPVEHVRNQAFQLLDDVEKKVVQSLKRQNQVALAQVEKAQEHLFPAGKPQERVLNPLYYLVRYGRPFLAQLLEAFERTPPTPEVEERAG